MLKTALIACALLAATPALAAKAPSPAAIEKAERAFAADGLALGVRDSFLKHMSDGAIIFRPDFVNARAFYEKRPSSKTPRLQWWPRKVVIDRAGQVGLSVGPWTIDGKRGGYYATLWRKDPQGWKWFYDGGADADASEDPGPARRAIRVPLGRASGMTPGAAADEVMHAERDLGDAAAMDSTAAYRSVLSADAWLLGPKGTETLDIDAIDARLAARPKSVELILMRTGISRDGDFAWTFGTARWLDARENRLETHYMHVWQRRAEGWRLIFETLNTDK